MNRFKMLRGNAWDRGTWGPRDGQHCFILAMEVMDNLPHDRYKRASPEIYDNLPYNY